MNAMHPPITGCGGVFKITGCIRKDVVEIKYIIVNCKYNKIIAMSEFPDNHYAMVTTKISNCNLIVNDMNKWI